MLRLNRPGHLRQQRFIAIAFGILAIAGTAHAQPQVEARPNERATPRDTLSRSRYSERMDIISAGVEFVASAGGGSFFEEYEKLGGAQSGLGPYFAPFAVGRIAVSDEFRVTTYASLHSAAFSELYDVRETPDPRSPAIAGVSENFKALAVPIVGGIEFAPLRTQFTSYVGAGAGIAITRTKWQSSVEYTTGGYVRPQRNSDGVGVAPVARAYAGVDLRFDEGSVNRAAFRGIFLEASYLWLPIARDYFAEIRARSERVEPAPAEDDATLYLGGLTFTFGLNLQVLHQ